MADHFDVFLSYSRRDKEAVEALAGALESRGLRPWLDVRELVPGSSWPEVLEDVIRSFPGPVLPPEAIDNGSWIIESVVARGHPARLLPD